MADAKGRALKWADVTPVQQLEGLERRTLAVTDQVMIVEFRSQPGVVIPVHQHPQDQVGYVVSGEIEMQIDGVTTLCRPGDSYAIPGGVPHGARFVTACTIIDCFAPPREDYR